MPQLHTSSRTGRRLLTTGLLSAVVVLGTPAVASAEVAPAIPDLGIPGLDGLPIPGTGGGSGTGEGTGGGTSGLPGAGDLPDPTESFSAGAECVNGLVTGIRMSVTDIAGGLAGLGGLLAGLPGGGTTVPLEPTSPTTAAATIPMDLDDLRELIGDEALAELLAGGQEDVTAQIEVIVGGAVSLVPVVLDFAACLAALIPTPEAAPPSTVAPAVPAAPAPTTVVPAPTTAPVAAAPVAYPGYAPTGGAPGEGSDAPLALAGLGVLTAAGASALWLRGRRGVTG